MYDENPTWLGYMMMISLELSTRSNQNLRKKYGVKRIVRSNETFYDNLKFLESENQVLQISQRLNV